MYSQKVYDANVDFPGRAWVQHPATSTSRETRIGYSQAMPCDFVDADKTRLACGEYFRYAVGPMARFDLAGNTVGFLFEFRQRFAGRAPGTDLRMGVDFEVREFNFMGDTHGGQTSSPDLRMRATQPLVGSLTLHILAPASGTDPRRPGFVNDVPITRMEGTLCGGVLSATFVSKTFMSWGQEGALKPP